MVSCSKERRGVLKAKNKESVSVATESHFTSSYMATEIIFKTRKKSIGLVENFTCNRDLLMALDLRFGNTSQGTETNNDFIDLIRKYLNMRWM